MTRTLRSLLAAILLALCAALAAPALAQPAGDAAPPGPLENIESRLTQWDQEAAKAEETLAQGELRPEAAGALREDLEAVRAGARAAADAARERLPPIQQQIEALGPAPTEGESEAESIAEERAQLNKRLENAKAIASKAELSFTRADTLLTDLAEQQRRRLTDRLLARGPTPLDPTSWIAAGRELAAAGVGLAQETVAAVGSRRGSLRESAPVALLAVLFAAAMMLFVRRAAIKRLYAAMGPYDPHRIAAETESAAFGGVLAGDEPRLAEAERGGGAHSDGPSRTRRLLVGIGLTLARLATPVLALGAVLFALRGLQILGPDGVVVVRHLALALVVLALAYAISWAFFAPGEARLRLSALDDRAARAASRSALALALAMAFGIAVVGSAEQLGFSEGALSVLNMIFVGAGAAALWRLAAATARHPKPGSADPEQDDAEPDRAEEPLMRLDTLARRGAFLVAALSPLLALIGYYALSGFIFSNFVYSAVLLGVCVLLFSVVQEISAALSEAAMDRRKLSGAADGAEDGEPRLGLLPVFAGFALTLAAGPLLALIWGATTDDLGDAYFRLTNGFEIGETTFRPADIIRFALVFGLGLFATRVIQAIMRRSVMPRTRLDAGARSSIVAGLGYVGFFLSVLLAISAGGLDLSNLALLAGALSVGIGFGLQNIVNNFVSGLILLIERPIKVGDWIVVGGTHGTVRKINVRSTEIETFDKASYIVPNSDLIAGAVMNMTHGDLMGRVIAPVGVAYGSDTRLVEKILLEIARAHPMVLRRPAPFVVFKAFGADALEFELRAYLRDVNWVLTTQSDINFEIDRRFREAGVEVPFKQHDVHVKDLDKMVGALTSARVPATRLRPGAPMEGGEPDADV